MKKTFFNFSLIFGFTVSQAIAQSAGGSAGTGTGGAGAGAGAAAGSSGAGANANVNANASGANVNAGAATTPAVPTTREPLPPAGNGQNRFSPAVPSVGAQGNTTFTTAGSNSFTLDVNATNGAGFGTNNAGTNFTAVTNFDQLTNHVFARDRFGTNFAGTNGINGTNGLGSHDVAATAFDRTLIIRLRFTIMQRLGGTPAAWAPVIFNSANGNVTVAGAVASTVIKQRVIMTVQTFPGVVRVIDQLSVDPNLSITAGIGAGANGVAAGGMIQTPRAAGSSNAGFLRSPPTNLAPAPEPSLGDSRALSRGTNPFISGSTNLTPTGQQVPRVFQTNAVNNPPPTPTP